MDRIRPGEHKLQLNDVELHYSIGGEGPVLLAHSGGPGMDARGWTDFAGLLQDLTIVQLHPRGSGLSGQPEGGTYWLSDYASDLEALRVHLDLEKPALIGWSHGGMVAQQYAFTYPDSLSKLVLYDTSAYFGDFLDDLEAAVKEFKDEPWFEKSFVALEKEWAGEYETGKDMAALWAEEMKFYFKKFDERAERYQTETGDLPVSVEALKFFNEKEAEGMDLRPKLGEIKVPTMIIVGRHDFITNVAMAEEMATRIPNAQLEIFENSGHFAHVEEPEKFRTVVWDFLLEDQSSR